MPRSPRQERCETPREKVDTANLETSARSALTPDLVDQELSAKLESELQMEKDMRDSDELPESIKDYLETGLFEVRGN